MKRREVIYLARLYVCSIIHVLLAIASQETAIATRLARNAAEQLLKSHSSVALCMLANNVMYSIMTWTPSEWDEDFYVLPGTVVE